MVTAKIWSDLFNVHNLDVSDLKAAVLKRAAGGATDAPEPAEIITAARAIRMDRADRETNDQRAAREEALDAKAEGRKNAIQQFAAGKRFAIEGETV